MIDKNILFFMCLAINNSELYADFKIRILIDIIYIYLFINLMIYMYKVNES